MLGYSFTITPMSLKAEAENALRAAHQQCRRRGSNKEGFLEIVFVNLISVMVAV